MAPTGVICWTMAQSDRQTATDEAIGHRVATRFPWKNSRAQAVREYIAASLRWFLESGLADPQFLAAICSDDEQRFWSRVSEALVAQRLSTKNFGPRPKKGEGPDLLLVDGGRRIWVEVVCPEPVGIPDQWLNPQPGVVHHMPHEEVLLRWTAAIHAKARRLFEGTAPGKKGYLEGGLVEANDAYVIAVNACRLRSGSFSELHGISTFPYAAEAVFPIGPYQINIDRETLEVVGRSHQHRLHVRKASGANVSTYMFMDPAYEAVSAIWALDLNGGSACGNQEPAVVIHNPLAKNPVAQGLLPADAEYVASDEGDSYELRKVEVHDQRKASPAVGQAE